MPDTTSLREVQLLAPERESLADSLRAAVSGKLGERRFGLWFGESTRLEVLDNQLAVEVPNAFFRDWIRSHFSDTLIEAGKEVTGRVLALRFQVGNEAPPHLGTVIDPPPASGTDHRAPSPVSIPTSPKKPKVQANRMPESAPVGPVERVGMPVGSSEATTTARPLRRFEDFVEGPSNRLAFAAAVEIAQNRGATFNPLVIHGGVGLGKTHLLEGVLHALRGRGSNFKVTHVTAESFTNGFLDALRTGSLPAFRSKYRNCEALIVDDVHFIAAKRATQDELLHTFNALHARGAAIVLACDQHPRRISRLTEELATRFLAGMVVKIESPDAATRKRILHAKALSRGIDVPDAVLNYIADHLRAGVRELEGALHSVIAHAVLTGKRLDLALAKTALRDTIRHTSRTLGLKDVERAVCGLFNIDGEQLRSDSRARNVTYPRMLAMYLARKHIGVAYAEIGRHFGGRNHSTVISAEKKVLAWLEDEKRIHRLDGFETTSEILASLESSLGS